MTHVSPLHSGSEELNYESHHLGVSSDPATLVAKAALSSSDLSLEEASEYDSPNLNSDLSKVKASKKYTLRERFKFTVWLPLKGKFCSLEEKRDKDLYEKHQALSAGIKKVQRAYQQYIAAEKAVDELDQGQPSQGLLLHELAKMQKLLDRYNKLIELAAATATSEEFSATDLKLDITEVLSGDKNIFHTINMVRAKMLSGTALLEDDRRVIVYGNEGSEEKIKEAYVDFVTHTVHHINEAALAAGRYDEEMITGISQAFVEGLASIRGEVDRISFHAELLKLCNPSQATDASEYEAKKNEMRSVVLNSFTRFLQYLMDGDLPITRSDIDMCQEAGICLTSVLDDGDIEILENLRNSTRLLEDAEIELTRVQDQHKEIKDELAASNGFSFTELEEFLSSIVDSKNIVPDAYYQVIKDLEKVDKNIQELESVISKYTDQLDQANQLVRENLAFVASLEQEGLAKKAAYEAKLRALKQNETKCQTEIESYEHLTQDFGIEVVQVGSEAIDRKYQVERTRLTAEIAEAKNQWIAANAKVNQAKEQHMLAIAEQKKLQDASVEIDQIRQNQIEFHAKRESLKNTTIELSGNDLLKFSTIRRTGSIRADNPIITAIADAVERQLKQMGIEEEIQTQEELVRKLQTENGLAMDKNPILNAAFPDRIAREIDSHLEIAEKITDMVNRVISNNNLGIRSLLKESDELLANLDNLDEEMESDAQVEGIRGEYQALSSDIFNRVKVLRPYPSESIVPSFAETDSSDIEEVVYSGDELL